MPWLAAAILVSGFLLTIASARVFALAFWRPLPALAGTSGAHEASTIEDERFQAAGPGRAFSLVPLLALTTYVVVAGVWPDWLLRLTDGGQRSA